jgi:hypothetical protein
MYPSTLTGCVSEGNRRLAEQRTFSWLAKSSDEITSAATCSGIRVAPIRVKGSVSEIPASGPEVMGDLSSFHRGH